MTWVAVILEKLGMEWAETRGDRRYPPWVLWYPRGAGFIAVGWDDRLPYTVYSNFVYRIFTGHDWLTLICGIPRLNSLLCRLRSCRPNNDISWLPMYWNLTWPCHQHSPNKSCRWMTKIQTHIFPIGQFGTYRVNRGNVDALGKFRHWTCHINFHWFVSKHQVWH